MSELMYCPHCNKAYKSPSAYHKHVDTCSVSPERLQLFADLVTMGTNIENARLVAKDLPEFLFALSKAMAVVGIKIDYEKIPILVLTQSGYGYTDDVRAKISVPKTLLAKGYPSSFVSSFSDLCRKYYFIPGFPDLDGFRWHSTYLKSLPAIAAQIKNDPIKQIDEHLVKINSAVTNYNTIVNNTANGLIYNDATIKEITKQKNEIQKVLKHLNTIESNRKAEITSSVRNNRIKKEELTADNIPDFYNHLSTFTVDLFVKEELEKVKTTVKKANDYLSKYPELWL